MYWEDYAMQCFQDLLAVGGASRTHNETHSPQWSRRYTARCAVLTGKHDLTAALEGENMQTLTKSYAYLPTSQTVAGWQTAR